MGALSDRDLNAFEIAKAFGEQHENEFAKLLFRPDIEVKTDARAASTGNVFIEYQQGRPQRSSGIAVTKAQWWVLDLVGLCIVVVETDRLRTLTRRAVELRLTKHGGDNHNKGAVAWLIQPWHST